MENWIGLCPGRVPPGPGDDQPGLREQSRTWGAELGRGGSSTMSRKQPSRERESHDSQDCGLAETTRQPL